MFSNDWELSSEVSNSLFEPDENLNIRQLQACAALCLRDYCQSMEIKHIEIDNLVSHLFRILLSDDLPTWEGAGACLAISGRGDLLPEYIEQIVPPQCLDEFHRLVEYSIEVGIVDMYGAPTGQPFKFLNKILEILNEANIETQSMKEIIGLSMGCGVWGEQLSCSDYKEISDIYKM